MHIIGTAGHVDHGKSALVHALTGAETDRLIQEKQRALTIELGFASYEDPIHKTIGIIDVPGHERFIHNMVRGTWAMRLALLCVASHDGWMKQTTDHAHILKGMSVPSIIVVITKIDAVDAKRIDEVRKEVVDNLQKIFSKTYPIHEVSAHNHVGIESLKKVIAQELQKPTKKVYPPMLYVDRSFILKGIGTVVTGSLVGKEVVVGENISILPAGKEGKIRSLQMFNKQVTKAIPVSRCAIALQGIHRDEVPKGSIVTTKPEHFSFCKEVYVSLTPITDNHTLKIKNHQHVTIAFGTNHIDASIHFLNKDKNRLSRLNLPQESHFYIGQPIVIMAVGGSNVLSFAKVVYTQPLNRKMQRDLASLFSSHNTLPSIYEEKGVLSLFLYSFVKNETHLPKTLVLEKDEYRKVGDFHIKSSLIQSLEESIIEKVSKGEGIPLQSAKYSDSFPSDLIETIINSLIAKHLIVLNEGNLMVANKEKIEISARAHELYELIEECGYQGYPVKSINKSDKEHIGSLLRHKQIIIIDSLFIVSTSTYKKMVFSLLNTYTVGSSFSIADAKNIIGLSRKYMIPLLVHIEKDGYIMRVGDTRKVIKHLEKE